MPANVDRFRGERSDDTKSSNVRHFESSIHTPAKGATIGFCLSGIPFIVSIHAPAKGATPAQPADCEHPTSFDPRSREGSDGKALCRIMRCAGFDPRSREGSDEFDVVHGSELEFRSTLPRRERPRQHFQCFPFVRVSIHAPAKGATLRSLALILERLRFRSTLPRRELRR